MKISYEVKTGIIVLISIGLLIWGINYLKGRDFFSAQKKFYAVYDHVDGLSRSNPVLLNGLKVGIVRDLEQMPGRSVRIVATIFVNSDLIVPKNSVLQIASTDLLGAKAIKIISGDSLADAKDGDTLKSSIEKDFKDEVSAQVAPVRQKAENLLASFDSVLVIMRNVFDERTKNNLRHAFESIANSVISIEHITANLDTTIGKQGKLKTIFDNLASITTNLKNNNEKISKIIENFAGISDTVAKSNLAATLDHTRKTLEQTSQLFEKINKGQGSLGQLANNDSLFNNLNISAHDLDELLKDLKENPKRYINFSVFGGGKKKK